MYLFPFTFQTVLSQGPAIGGHCPFCG